MATEAARDSETLAEFPRRNRDTGRHEAIRITAGEFNGRIYTHVRLYYPAGGGVLRPSKVGAVLREHELDRAIGALERVRDMVRAEGRSTSEAPPGPCQSPDGPALPGGKAQRKGFSPVLMKPSATPDDRPGALKPHTSRTVAPWEDEPRG